MQKSRIAGLIMIGIIIVSAIGITIVATAPFKLEIGQEEIAQYIVGMAVHEPYAEDQEDYHGQDSWLYYDYESGKLRSEDYSTWRPNYLMSNTAVDFDFNSFTFDLDDPLYSMPDTHFEKITKYPSDSDGDELADFVVTPVHRTFTDQETGATRDISFYRTFFTTQYSIDITAHTGSLSTQSNFWATTTVVQIQGEMYGDYKQYKIIKTWDTMGGMWADFRIIIRTDVKNMAMGNYIHIDEGYEELGNAVLWSKITHTNTSGIDGTTDFIFPARWGGDDRQMDKILYPTLKDAMLKTNQIPDKTPLTIQLEDTLYPSVYMPIDFRGLVGCTYLNTIDDTIKWSTFTKTDLFYHFEVTTCIMTTFAEPITHSEGKLVIVDPFNEKDPSDDPTGWSEFLQWLMDAWDFVYNKWWFWLIVVGVALVIMVAIIGPGPTAKIFASIGRLLFNIVKTLIIIPFQMIKQTIKKDQQKQSFKERLGSAWSKS